ncbi:alpha-L-glutamate ligase [Halalkalibacterium halodurans]|uniref:Alpha-L-glutamate ligase n=2 Tax=Halalkalibacterium halodurans TaxID=86665 RepID=A0A0M0KBU9_ALKHA|nr:alpha-L-glutamate ligase [Halalkalibacterium halodurans]MED3648458.1 alpha-L-glutamate ligase [Halalkalibacterium halodurans]TPE70292.1 alpha-L-glutamate ligase [Halalkalibacterium halodurans]
MKKIYVIHENDEWTVHLFKRLEELGLPYEDWHLRSGSIKLHEAPPEGVFYNRMSASSHTRGHRYAPELAGAVLAWLERHGRTVINGSRALQLEVSKVNQYMALETFGITTPKTIVAVGKKELLDAAASFEGQAFITKHNRAGKGLGVQLFQHISALKEYVESDEFEEPVDGITLLQQYIQAAEPYITRCEFVGGAFLYAVRVDTSEGFELCPADTCSIESKFCPVGEEPTSKFQICKDFHDPVIEKYEQVLKANDIQVAGIECIRDKDGTLYTYDINTNTNYNSEAEQRVGQYGMLEVAKYLKSLLSLE